jgi:hypothetical protein
MSTIRDRVLVAIFAAMTLGGFGGSIASAVHHGRCHRDGRAAVEEREAPSQATPSRTSL